MSTFVLIVICSESSILAPLETLNTNLNYKILDNFLGNMTDSTSKLFVLNPSAISLPNGSFCFFVFESIELIDIFLAEMNRLTIESNEKKTRNSFTKLTQYSINTINELPERSIDEDR